MTLRIASLHFSPAWVEVIVGEPGKATGVECRTLFENVLAACMAYDIRSIVLDCSALSSSGISSIDQQLEEHIARAVTSLFRIAILDSALCDHRYPQLERVMSGKGGNVQLFREREEALNWLLSGISVEA